MPYMVTFTINIPPMLAYIYHTWILWDMKQLIIGVPNVDPYPNHCSCTPKPPPAVETLALQSHEHNWVMASNSQRLNRWIANR